MVFLFLAILNWTPNRSGLYKSVLSGKVERVTASHPLPLPSHTGRHITPCSIDLQWQVDLRIVYIAAELDARWSK